MSTRKAAKGADDRHTMRGGNTFRHAYNPTLGLMNIVTRSDMDAVEYMAADWMMASKTRRYLTKLKIARECHLQWSCTSELSERNTFHIIRACQESPRKPKQILKNIDELT